MKNMSLPRGFTLIELLVIVAIIGILSAAVLVSLSSSRGRGNDAAIKSSLQGLASQAEIYYVNNGQYASAAITNTCTGGVFSDTVVAQALASVDNNNGAGAVRCYANGSVYAVQSARPANAATTYWCVDSANKRCGSNTQITTTNCGTCTSQI